MPVPLDNLEVNITLKNFGCTIICETTERVIWKLLWDMQMRERNREICIRAPFAIHLSRNKASSSLSFFACLIAFNTAVCAIVLIAFACLVNATSYSSFITRHSSIASLRREKSLSLNARKVT